MSKVTEATMKKRRSNTKILDFIKALPGGNPIQYARLLNTTAIRINTLLLTSAGKALVRADMVRAAPKGILPAWAIDGITERGALTSADLFERQKNGTLPAFITDKLNLLNPKFREDGLMFYSEAIDQAGGGKTFEQVMDTQISAQVHMTNHLIEVQQRLSSRETEIARIESMLDRVTRVAEVATNRLLEPYQGAAPVAAIEAPEAIAEAVEA